MPSSLPLSPKINSLAKVSVLSERLTRLISRKPGNNHGWCCCGLPACWALSSLSIHLCVALCVTREIKYHSWGGAQNPSPCIFFFTEETSRNFYSSFGVAVVKNRWVSRKACLGELKADSIWWQQWIDYFIISWIPLFLAFCVLLPWESKPMICVCWASICHWASSC